MKFEDEPVPGYPLPILPGHTSPGRLERVLRSGAFAITSELDPPDSADPEDVYRRARVFDGYVDAINATDGSGANCHMSSLAVCALLTRKGYAPVMQISCRDKNRIAIQGDILGGAAMGVCNMLCLSGDGVQAGDHPQAKPVFDLDCMSLLEIGRGLRDDHRFQSGRKITYAPRVFFGAAANPFGLPFEWRAERLAKKVQAGAQFIQTQYCYDVPRLREFMQRVEDLGPPGQGLHPGRRGPAALGQGRRVDAHERAGHPYPGQHPEACGRRREAGRRGPAGLHRHHPGGARDQGRLRHPHDGLPPGRDCRRDHPEIRRAAGPRALVPGPRHPHHRHPQPQGNSVTDTVISSAKREVVIGFDRPFVIIGERINPTGRKILAAEMVAGDFSRVSADALAQVEAGAHMLDVNAGIPLADEPALLARAIELVQSVTDVPLSIDSSIVAALEAGLAVYKGKALVNSVTGEEDRLETVLPLVKKYGAAVVAISNDETGISQDPDVRFAVAKKIVERAADYGIPACDIVVDPLVMPIGAINQAGVQVMALVHRLRTELKVNTTCGASNVSFGLPERNGINAAFLTMAIGAGMTSAITNPLHEEVIRATMGADVMMGHDPDCARWIRKFRAEPPVGADGEAGRGRREVGRRRRAA
jgi:5-methyltetrahydrofolate--homocysteine methyltransferase